MIKRTSTNGLIAPFDPSRQSLIVNAASHWPSIEYNTFPVIVFRTVPFTTRSFPRKTGFPKNSKSARSPVSWAMIQDVSPSWCM